MLFLALAESIIYEDVAHFSKERNGSCVAVDRVFAEEVLDWSF